MISVKDYLTVYDPGEDIVAVISKDDVFYKEDFASLMNEANLAPTEKNLQRVWNALSGSIPHNSSLREICIAAIEKVKINLLRHGKPSLDTQINSASVKASRNRSNDNACNMFVSEKKLSASKSRS